MKKVFKIISIASVICLLVIGSLSYAQTSNQQPSALTPGKAHVILLAGQSNASGQSVVSFLEEKATTEDYQKYEAGYENVLIRYTVDNGANVSNGFVPVTLGQGASTLQFGPEVGIADYLSTKYPDETFYIIKSSWSGTAIGSDWQTNDTVYNTVISGMNDSFQILEEQGLDPELFAFCWMQGEGDSVVYSYAEDYYNQLSNLVARIFTRYDQYASPAGIAFVDGGISDHADWKFHQIVNGAKAQYASEQSNRYFLDTQAEGLEYHVENNDPAHYDSLSMIRLGEMFGEAIGKVIGEGGTAQ